MISLTMSLDELAFVVYDALKAGGIDAVLSGGAVVSIYTQNRYQSLDLDFISSNQIKDIERAMWTIGFKRRGKNFTHGQTQFTVEFPTGPLAVGNELLRIPNESVIGGRKIKILSPTNAIKDRLSGYFYFHDPQNLEQAKMIYRAVGGRLAEIKQWAEREGELEKISRIRGLAEI